MLARRLIHNPTTTSQILRTVNTSNVSNKCYKKFAKKGSKSGSGRDDCSSTERGPPAFCKKQNSNTDKTLICPSIAKQATGDKTASKSSSTAQQPQEKPVSCSPSSKDAPKSKSNSEASSCDSDQVVKECLQKLSEIEKTFDKISCESKKTLEALHNLKQSSSSSSCGAKPPTPSSCGSKPVCPKECSKPKSSLWGKILGLLGVAFLGNIIYCIYSNCEENQGHPQEDEND